jgi:hypothetical protein
VALKPPVLALDQSNLQFFWLRHDLVSIVHLRPRPLLQIPAFRPEFL